MNNNCLCSLFDGENVWLLLAIVCILCSICGVCNGGCGNHGCC